MTIFVEVPDTDNARSTEELATAFPKLFSPATEQECDNCPFFMEDFDK